MQSILSIQSHVVYGYVGNKAATYPLQYMGYDVCPLHTVQFSNHTGYQKWQGKILKAKHILSVVQGLLEIGVQHHCKAILSGYIGSESIGEAIQQIVQQFKSFNKDIIYLCDPVIGDNGCYVKPEVLEFFKKNLNADIVTPNQYEAEVLSGILIEDVPSLQKATQFFHNQGIKMVVITGLKMKGHPGLQIFASNEAEQFLVQTEEYEFNPPLHGTGDLFASTFLGVYLKNHNMKQALQTAVFYLKQALLHTQRQSQQELQVTTVKYDCIEDSLLPKVVCF